MLHVFLFHAIASSTLYLWCNNFELGSNYQIAIFLGMPINSTTQRYHQPPNEKILDLHLNENIMRCTITGNYF